MQTAAVKNEGAQPSSLALGDHVFNKLLKERIIWLGSEVAEGNANQICAQMMLLAAQDPEKPIFLYINSPGGSVTAGMAIYDTMQYIEPEVVTVALGMAASMGQLLLTAGTPGKRYATPHARILMHQPSGGVGGTASDIRINANLILQMKQELAEINAQRTGKTVEEIREDSERDHWFTAQEALEYGFIDHVIESARNLGADGKEL
ncbi:ATP-dependent Clp protease proteolytic subunit [Varibaculum vaginae]|uniref:ATP-dependent Clp protease proteolytic subunit n=1 Tax=Varibaculum vaginae TaxID=2364797 RepID=UPI000F08575F|nr:ATP-dependent Clp protease proteolytic subunit [Varibaculum vaginae]